MFGAERPHLIGVGDEVGGARNAVDADLLSGQPGADLVAHHLDGLRGRADEGHPTVSHRPGEVSILREEAVAGMHRVGAAPVDGRKDGLGVEVALGGCLTPEGVGLVS